MRTKAKSSENGHDGVRSKMHVIEKSRKLMALLILAAASVTYNDHIIKSIGSSFRLFNDCTDQVGENRKESMHVLYSLSGSDAGFLDEFNISLKSVMLNSPLDMSMTIHILADKPAYDALESVFQQAKLESWITRNQIIIKTYNMEDRNEAIRQRLSNFKRFQFSFMHTVGAFYRLIAQEVIEDRSVGHVMYLDTDVAIMSNLGELWRHKNDTSLFQWGKMYCSGFLLINLNRFREEFWKLLSQMDANTNISAPGGMNDQHLLRLVQDNYPELVSPLPPEWDNSIAAGVWRWKDEESILKNRPKVGYVHLNGGGWSKESAFRVHDWMKLDQFNTTWWAAKYYATMPWQWAKFALESQRKRDEQGYQVLIDYYVQHNMNSCPLAFGLGHQKSGTTTVVMALASVSNHTGRDSVWQLWNEESKTDEQLLEMIHNRNGMIQKEGHALVYADQMARLCPNMRFYVVRRDLLSVVRSVADRLELNATSSCSTRNINELPAGWRSLFHKSADDSCLVRIAAHYLGYEERLREFASNHPVDEITYEDYTKDPLGSIQHLCKSLGVLGPCNSKTIDTKQYQARGKNAGKNFTEIWPAEVVQRLQQMAEKGL